MRPCRVYFKINASVIQAVGIRFSSVPLDVRILYLECCRVHALKVLPVFRYLDADSMRFENWRHGRRPPSNGFRRNLYDLRSLVWLLGRPILEKVNDSDIV